MAVRSVSRGGSSAPCPEQPGRFRAPHLPKPRHPRLPPSAWGAPSPISGPQPLSGNQSGCLAGQGLGLVWTEVPAVCVCRREEIPMHISGWAGRDCMGFFRSHCSQPTWQPSPKTPMQGIGNGAETMIFRGSLQALALAGPLRDVKLRPPHTTPYHPAAPYTTSPACLWALLGFAGHPAHTGHMYLLRGKREWCGGDGDLVFIFFLFCVLFYIFFSVLK